MVTAMRTVLETQKVRMEFLRGAYERVVALDGVDLQVQERDFVTIIGSNGAGKSTLLNIVAGVFPPERRGKVIINGNDVTNWPEYKRAAFIGRVWQDPSMGTAANLTIEENLSLAYQRGQTRLFRGALGKQRKELYREALSHLGLGLEDRFKSLVGTLSGGQRQSLALVMATISKPAILLLDEHIATLDPRTAKKVLELTELIVREEKMTAMMVTHNMEHALRYGNRLLMMHQGKIVVDIDAERKSRLTIDDLIDAFGRAAGEQFKDDTILLRHD